jgi:hypothetical protein
MNRKTFIFIAATFALVLGASTASASPNQRRGQQGPTINPGFVQAMKNLAVFMRKHPPRPAPRAKAPPIIKIPQLLPANNRRGPTANKPTARPVFHIPRLPRFLPFDGRRDVSVRFPNGYPNK